MPEFLSVGNPGNVITSITDVLDRWIRLPEERQRATNDLLDASEDFIDGGAIQKCAGIILEKLPMTASSAAVGYIRKSCLGLSPHYLSTVASHSMWKFLQANTTASRDY